MATKSKQQTNWADIEDENDSVISAASTPSIPSTSSTVSTVKFSYAMIASKGVAIANDSCKKKCENAVIQWAKTNNNSKSTSSVNKLRCGDEEIICNRCAIPFVYTRETKQKNAERGWKTPKICKVCSHIRYQDRKKGCS